MARSWKRCNDKNISAVMNLQLASEEGLHGASK